MPNSLHRMIKHHPRAGEAHDFADFFSHVFAVAVGWAFLAGCLLVAIFACRESFVGVCFQFSASVAEVDALPGAKVEFAVGDGDCEADAEEGAFCVGRHVVGAFQCVLVICFPFLDHVVEDRLHVCADIGVVVLVDGQCA